MKNKLINLALESGIVLEILENKSDVTELSFLNDEEKSFQITNVTTYNIKAIKNNQCTQIVTESLKRPQEIIAALENIFTILDNKNPNYLTKGYIKGKKIPNEPLDYQMVKKDFLSLNSLKKDYPLISSLEMSFAHLKNTTEIKNTEALKYDEAQYNEYSIAINLKKDDISKIAYVTYYSTHYDFANFKKLVIEKIENLLLKMNSSSCLTQKYNVILTNNVMADLLATFSSMFDAKKIALKESFLTDKYQEKVFSDKLTIIEDPHFKEGIIAELFDDEGTNRTYKEIIKNGKFVKKINNLEYAIKNKEEATGNANGVSNLYVKPDDNSFASLYQDLEEGIIIDEAYGWHSGVNLKTGDISLQSEGLLVQNGKIVKGLNMIIISTNLKELLNNVVKIGNDLSKSRLSIFAPSILFKDITIAGKE